MASYSKEKGSERFSKSTDMAHIYTEPNFPSPIPTDRIMEAMRGPHSVWMMQEGPIDYHIRWGASLWPSCVKESELDTFRERYRILDTVEMFVLTPDKRVC